jgi:beta-xylosidase
LNGIVTSDEFSQTTLLRQWQWNHNPVVNGWSLSSRPGFFRITSTRVDSGLPTARNTLTQRTFGPTGVATVAVEMGGLNSGDYAGLGALQQNFGFVGVAKSGTARYVVMRNGSQEIARIGVSQDRLYLRAAMDFRNQIDRATFYYSLDGNNWQAIGNVLQMSYTIPHFMGYRFALFNYATQTAGGFADFDYFRITE